MASSVGVGAAIGGVSGGALGTVVGGAAGIGGGTLVAPGVGTIGGGVSGAAMGFAQGTAAGTIAGGALGGGVGFITCMSSSADGGGDSYKTPRSNTAQNKQVADAIREAERKLGGRKLTPDEKRRVHDWIHGQGFGYHEIVREVLNMFGGR